MKISMGFNFIIHVSYSAFSAKVDTNWESIKTTLGIY